MCVNLHSRLAAHNMLIHTLIHMAHSHTYCTLLHTHITLLNTFTHTVIERAACCLGLANPKVLFGRPTLLALDFSTFRSVNSENAFGNVNSVKFYAARHILNNFKSPLNTPLRCCDNSWGCK